MEEEKETDMDKEYKTRETEQKWQKKWKEDQVYRYRKESDDKVFSIDTPPPTISGKTHMGHVYGFIQQDFIARFKRMQGFEVYYPFGFDDNGIATERFTTRRTGKNPREVGREKFSELCKGVAEETENKMRNIWNNLGISADWNLLYRTISDEVKKKSQLSFIKLYKDGKEYKKKGPTLWCPECSTAVSQVELEDKEIDSYFNDLVFKLEDGEDLIISTTRPELLPACVSIFVHPEDPRSEELVGKKAKVPLFDHDVPIKEDERVEMEKGSGIVMCCTFGDQTDMEWYYAHDLPLRLAIDREGNMTDLADKYEGMDVNKARKAIVEDLKEENLLKDRREITHEVNTHERCGEEIEFFITEQWFVEILDNKEEFLEAGRKMDWYPEHLFTRYKDWIEGLQWDWCISRQRYFGIPFPVWYCKECGEVVLADEEELPVNPLEEKPSKDCPVCGNREFEPEEDVFDTWATSSLTPLINANWDGEDYDEEIFPMTLRPQGHDIISFWLFHTVVKSLYHTGQVPFRDVLINGMVLDPEGRKMSKSKGNVVVPEEIMEEFPADAIRYWASGSKSGEDLPFKEKDIETGRKLLTKLWNASKFSSQFLKEFEPGDRPGELEKIDKWILYRLDETVERITNLFENYEFGKVREEFSNFFWSDFCDNYLEIAKKRLYSESGEEKRSAQFALYNVLLNSLKMLAPIMPHATEEIYQDIFGSQESLHRAPWPEKVNLSEESDKEKGENAVEVISAIRRYKSDQGVPLNSEVERATVYGEGLKEMRETIKNAMNIEILNFEKGSPEMREEIIDVGLNFEKLGPKYGGKVNAIKEASQDENMREIKNGKMHLKVSGETLTLEEDEFALKKEYRLENEDLGLINSENYTISVKI